MLLINETLIKMMKGLKRYIVFITLLKILILMATVYFTQALSQFLGNLFDPQMTVEQLFAAILAAAASAGVLIIGHVLVGEAEFLCTSKARIRLRQKITDKIFELDTAYIESAGPSNLINLAASGVENMQIYYCRYLPSLLFCLVAPFYMFLRLRRYSPLIAWLLLVITLSILPLNNIFRSITEKLKKGFWASMQDLTGYFLEGLRGMTTIKLFNRDEERVSLLADKAHHFYANIMEVMSLNFKSFVATYSMIYLSVLVSAIISARKLSLGDLKLSGALLVLMLSFSFFSSVRDLSNATHSALAGVSAAQNLSDLFAFRVERTFTHDSERAFEEKGLRMEHISFSYDGKRTILNDVSMFFEEGKVSAIAGSSGCGKSTAAALLLRFLEPQAGSLYLDGVPVTDYSLRELRKKIIMVPQKVSVFSGTLRENLLVAREDATDEELWEVLSEVDLAKWAKGRPEGLDINVGNAGDKLSGGQKQKIGIARALLSKAPYIVLDEATSSVDMESEQDIWRCIGKLSGGHALIIISHRLSTIRNADRIYVLNNGQLAGNGSHEELMESCSLYKRLVEEQNALEKIGEECP